MFSFSTLETISPLASMTCQWDSVVMRSILAGLMAFVLSLLLGPRVIRFLLSLKVGQPLRSAEEVHKLAELHGGKIGTPTMGGVLILSMTILATLVFAKLNNPFIWVTLFSLVAHGVLGFCDDYKKVREKKSDGVSSRTKLFWQLVIALAIAAALWLLPSVAGHYTLASKPISVTDLYVPIFHTVLPLSLLFFPFIIITLIACSNAINLTDGLDGLASGCTISTSFAYGILAIVAVPCGLFAEKLGIPLHPHHGELAVFLAALIGSCFGFIWFNGHPAKVFMGDTGSLAIGGALGAVAICLKQELLFVLIGGVFVAEAASVVIQTVFYKLTKKPNQEGKMVGKRVFRMAPLHHHFELGGLHESQVIIRFWILSILLAVIGLTLTFFI